MMILLRRISTVCAAVICVASLTSCVSTEQASSTTPVSFYANAAPLDLRLSAWPYPYPLKEFKTSLQGQPAAMVYMDVAAVGKQKVWCCYFMEKTFPVIIGLPQLLV